MADMNKILTNVQQNLSDTAKAMARSNIGACGNAPDDALYANHNGKWFKVNFVTPEMFGAKGDGIEDDSKAIQAAIETELPVIGNVRKIYRIEQNIVVGQGTLGHKYHVENCHFEIPTRSTDAYVFGLFNFKEVIFRNCKFVGLGDYVRNGDQYVIEGMRSSGLHCIFPTYNDALIAQDFGNVLIDGCYFENMDEDVTARNGHKDNKPNGKLVHINCTSVNSIMSSVSKYFETHAFINNVVYQHQAAARRFSHIYYAGVYLPNSYQIVSDCVLNATGSWPIHCDHTDYYNVNVSNCIINDYATDRSNPMGGVLYVVGSHSNVLMTGCSINAPKANLLGYSANAEDSNRTIVVEGCKGSIQGIASSGSIGERNGSVVIQSCTFETDETPLWIRYTKFIDCDLTITKGGITRNPYYLDATRCSFHLKAPSSSTPVFGMGGPEIYFTDCKIFNESVVKDFQLFQNSSGVDVFFVQCSFFRCYFFNEGDYTSITFAGCSQVDMAQNLAVTIPAPADCSLVVKNGDTTLSTGDTIPVRASISAQVFPDTNYLFDHWSDWRTNNPRTYSDIRDAITIDTPYVRSESSAEATGYEFLEFNLPGASMSLSAGDGTYKLHSRNFASLLSAGSTPSLTNSVTTLSSNDYNGPITVTSTVTNPSGGSTTDANGYIYTNLILPKMRNCVVSFDIEIISNPLNTTNFAMRCFDESGGGHRIYANIESGHVVFKLGEYMSARANQPNMLFVSISLGGVCFILTNLQVEYMNETSFVPSEDRGTVTITSGVQSGSFSPAVGGNVLVQTSGSVNKMVVAK